MLSDKELIERYIRAAWVLKIRLMSSRMHLWADLISEIHIETALLQLRKACESITYMCVIAAEYEIRKPDKQLRTNYHVGAVLKFLQRKNALMLPSTARLAKQGDPGRWELRISKASQTEIDRLKGLHDRCGHFMHEFKPFEDFPADNEVALAELSSKYNFARAEHQWLWNLFWEHAVFLREKLLHIHLGDDTQSTMPRIMNDEGLFDGELRIVFDPEHLADFVEPVTWKNSEKE